jgi:hypothetical protein
LLTKRELCGKIIAIKDCNSLSRRKVDIDMKVSEMIKNLQEFMNEYGDVECWYSMDDEGNDFCKVSFEPSVCYVDKNGCAYSDEEEAEVYSNYPESIKTVCIVN